MSAGENDNEPGRFTALLGYERTSDTGANNLHRNVIFRDNGDKVAQIDPFTTLKPLGNDNPRVDLGRDAARRDLWHYWAAHERAPVRRRDFNQADPQSRSLANAGYSKGW